MVIIGCDYHPGFQQIAFVDTETGECGERRLTHREEAEQFYSALKGRTVRVGTVGITHVFSKENGFDNVLRAIRAMLPA